MDPGHPEDAEGAAPWSDPDASSRTVATPVGRRGGRGRARASRRGRREARSSLPIARERRDGAGSPPDDLLVRVARRPTAPWQSGRSREVERRTNGTAAQERTAAPAPNEPDGNRGALPRACLARRLS